MLISASAARLQNVTVLRIFPERVSITVGQATDIKVVVDEVVGLFAVDIRITFDPTIIEVVDANPTLDGIQISPGHIPYPDFIVKNEANNAVGMIWYVVTQLNPRAPADGSGTMMTMRLRAKHMGISFLDISDLIMVTRDGLPLPADSWGGEVWVLGQAGETPRPITRTATPVPSPIVSPTPSPTYRVISSRMHLPVVLVSAKR